MAPENRELKFQNIIGLFFPTWNLLQQSSPHLYREEEEDGAPVEQVVYGGGREAKPVLLQAAQVGEGDHGGGDGGPYIAPLANFILFEILDWTNLTMITGIPSLSVIALLATRATITEEVAEEDCEAANVK